MPADVALSAFLSAPLSATAATTVTTAPVAAPFLADATGVRAPGEAGAVAGAGAGAGAGPLPRWRPAAAATQALLFAPAPALLRHPVPAPAAAPEPPRPDLPSASSPERLPEPPRDPATLHPLVWRAHQLGLCAAAVQPSGWATLDAQLPGGGWPQRALTELLLPHPGVGEIRLLAPALAAVQRSGRLVMLFDPPATLCAWALAALGIAPEQLLLIHSHPSAWPGATADSLWALEQALKSGHVGAVLAWLPPRLRAERLRRLQLAAAAAHNGPAFVLREPAAAGQATPAPLRLLLAPAGGDHLTLHLLKRRGPPLPAPLRLRLPGVLGTAATRRAQHAGGAQGLAQPGRAACETPAAETLAETPVEIPAEMPAEMPAKSAPMPGVRRAPLRKRCDAHLPAAAAAGAGAISGIPTDPLAEVTADAATHAAKEGNTESNTEVTTDPRAWPPGAARRGRPPWHSATFVNLGR